MPPIFKALASIAVWILSVGAWVLILTSLVFGTLSGNLFVVEVTPPIFYPIVWALAGAFLVLSVVCMKLRQMLE